jgi:O-antigen ligase/tetratricopeptide (TPR) repeat protein
MSPLAAKIERLALILLLAVMAARPFLAEISFSQQAPQPAVAQAGEGQLAPAQVLVDKGELARVTFAIAILAIAAIYLTSTAVSGRLAVRQPIIGALIATFIVLSLISALYASNKRAALDGWLEQASLLVAFFLAIQLVRTRLRFVLVVCVLAGLAAAMSAKGFYQYFVESPEAVRDFLSDANQKLLAMGIEPDSVQARAFVNRMMDRSAIGYLGLSNIFASLLIVLTFPAVGLAIQKLRWALQARRQWRRQSKSGQIHLPTSASIAAVVLAIAPLAVLLMTKSRAGIALAALALIGAIVLMFVGPKLARHWQACTAIAAGAVFLVITATLSYGLAKDSLPGTSMTFRWYYWRASADIVAQHPLIGVGQANFPSAYLSVRRPAAEESVKTPHNFIAQNFSEVGLPAGMIFLAIIVLALLQIARPVAQQPGLAPGNNNTDADRRLLPCTFAAILIAVSAGMLAFGMVPWNWAVILIDVVVPALVLAGALAVTFWFARDLASQATNFATMHIFLALGLLAFILHNLVEFSLFVPAPAMVFWIALGSLVGQKPGSREFQPPRFLRLVRPAFVWSVVIAATVLLWLPVSAKTALNEQLANISLSSSPDDGTARRAKLAGEVAQADVLDPLSAIDAARYTLAISPWQAQQWASQATGRDPASPAAWALAAEASLFARSGDAYIYSWQRSILGRDSVDELQAALKAQPDNPILLSRLAGLLYAGGQYDQAGLYCQRAIQLTPASPMLWIHLGDCLWQTQQPIEAHEAWLRAAGLAPGDQSYLDMMAQAVARNPSDSRLRVRYADMLLLANQPAQAIEQLDKSAQLQSQLLPGSVEALTASEQADIKALRARAKCLSGKS